MHSTVRSAAIALLLGAPMALIASGHPAFAGSKRVAYVPKVSLADARAAALADVPGTIKAEELEKEGGRWIYTFEIRPSGETRRLIKEVNIDADTGKRVGKIETEKDD